MTRTPKPIRVGPIWLDVMASRGCRDGRWYWRARTYEGKREHTVWTGRATAKEATKKAAELHANGEERAAKTGEYRPDTTIEILLRAWRGEVVKPDPDVRPSSKAQTKSRARALVAKLGAIRIDRLTARDLVAYRDARYAEGRSRRTVQAELFFTLAPAWRWARGIGLAPDRDLALPEIRIPKDDPKRVPTQDEIERVHAQLAGWPRIVHRLLHATGARIGEIGSLRWCDVDEARGELRVTGKTDARIVPVRPEVLKDLQAWHPSDAHPTDTVSGVRSSTCSREMGDFLRDACEAEGIEPYTAHALRRAMVDTLRRAGVDVATAAKWLGHSPAVMLKVYAQPDENDLRRAMEAAQPGTMKTAHGRVVRLVKGAPR